MIKVEFELDNSYKVACLVVIAELLRGTDKDGSYSIYDSVLLNALDLLADRIPEYVYCEIRDGNGVDEKRWAGIADRLRRAAKEIDEYLTAPSPH